MAAMRGSHGLTVRDECALLRVLRWPLPPATQAFAEAFPGLVERVPGCCVDVPARRMYLPVDEVLCTCGKEGPPGCWPRWLAS